MSSGLIVLPGSSGPFDKVDVQGLNLKNELMEEETNFDNTLNSSVPLTTLSNNIYFPSVIDFLRGSGGITPFSDVKNIEITRINSITDGGGRKNLKINLLSALDLKDIGQNIRVLDGDTIFVKKNKVPIVSEISK